MLSRFLMNWSSKLSDDDEATEKLGAEQETAEVREAQVLDHLQSCIDQHQIEQRSRVSFVGTQNFDATEKLANACISDEQFSAHLQSCIDQEVQHQIIDHTNGRSAKEERDILQTEISKLLATQSAICKHPDEQKFHSERLANLLVCHNNRVRSNGTSVQQEDQQSLQEFVEEKSNGEENKNKLSDSTSFNNAKKSLSGKKLGVSIKQERIKVQKEESREKIKRIFNNPPKKSRKNVINKNVNPRSKLEIKQDQVREQHERESRQMKCRKSKTFQPGQLQDTTRLVFSNPQLFKDCESSENNLFQSRFIQHRKKKMVDQYKWRNVTYPKTIEKEPGVKIFPGFKPAPYDALSNKTVAC